MSRQYSGEKHKNSLPSLRKIRRSCNRELFRTIKRLKIWIPPEQMIQAEEIYFRKVCSNLLWIAANESNHKVLSDWWEENVCAEIAALWNLQPIVLAKAFRESFGG